MHPTTLLTTLALLGLPMLALPQTIDPNSVPRPLRNTWCENQKRSCPLLCAQLPGSSATVRENRCDAATLDYGCICGNGMQPNASEYSETIPYYTCTEFNNQCVRRCGNNNACQSACRENNPCGAQNPTLQNTSTISTMSATATSGQATSTGGEEVFTTFGGSLPTDSASASASVNGNAGAAAVDLGRSYGLGAVALGIFAGFALVL